MSQNRAAKAKDLIDELESELDRKDDEIKDLESALEQRAELLDEANAEIRSLKDELRDLEKQYGEVESTHSDMTMTQ